MNNITKLILTAIKQHIDTLFAKDKFRYTKNNKLVSTEVYESSYYPNPYNKEVADFCVAFFKKLQNEGISIRIDDTVNTCIYISSTKTVDLKKIADDLEYEVNRHFYS
jgi:hypothetical protein